MEGSHQLPRAGVCASSSGSLLGGYSTRFSQRGQLCEVNVNSAVGGSGRGAILSGIASESGHLVLQQISARTIHGSRPEAFSFKKLGLYFIVDGGNDISYAIQANSSEDRIRNVIIPEVVSNFSSAITRLYTDLGARQFLIPGCVPLGCTAIALAQGWPALNPAYGPIGKDGCAQGINDFAKVYNDWLRVVLQSLRNRLSKVTIIYGDIYFIIYDAVTNPTKYGFAEGLQACRGSGGPPYNFNTTLGECVYEGATACSDPSQFVSWDGVHYTQAMYKVVARTILQGKFVDPPEYNFSTLCHLDFSKFDDNYFGG